MSIKITFLGTSASIPTVERSLPAVLILRENEQLMFDCGEGVQRQMITSKAGFNKKLKVFISHLHGDHVLGLAGLLQTMGLMSRQRKVHVYGPAGIKQFLWNTKNSLKFGLTFPVEINEILDSGVVCTEKEYVVKAVWANHSVESFAYAFVENQRAGKFYPDKARALGVSEGFLWSELQKGKQVTLPSGAIIKPNQVLGPKKPGRKIIYSGDTKPFKGFSRFAAGADLIIHEATFDDSLAEKAAEDGHSTPNQAAKVAAKAKAKNLILTHISARYKDDSLLLEQAQRYFRNTSVAKDFMQLKLPLPNR